MLSKPIPKWVLTCGFLLAANAGCVNAIGFVGLNHQALTHVSGPVTLISTQIMMGETRAAMIVVGTTLAFFTGCVLSAIVIRHGALNLDRRYGVALLIEAALLAASWDFIVHDLAGGAQLAAMACGLQNAMVSSYSGAVIRTTHMTGIVTDLGISTGQFLRGVSVDRRRAGLYVLLLGGFCLGGLAGTFGFLHVGFKVLLVPSLFTGLLGVACLVKMGIPRRRIVTT